MSGSAETPLPTYLVRAAAILAAPVGPTPIDTPDGPLVKQEGTWTAERVARPDVQAALRNAEAAGDMAALEVALGSHDTATLTGDGRWALTRQWCSCTPGPDAGTWVRYERYTARGREAHGYVCPGCRHLVQSG